MSHRIRPARRTGSFDWDCDEPELIEYATEIGLLWLQREKQRKHVTADILNKACGILSEEIFSADLNELNIPHLRTVPLLSKEHPVNKGKPYDIKIQDVTIDVKANSPIPCKEGWGHSESLNLNKAESDAHGACDIYVATKDMPELPFEQGPDKQDEKAGLEFAVKILKQVKRVKFLGWAYGKELIQEANLKQGYAPYYQLFPRELHSMQEFEVKFRIPLEVVT